MELVLWTALGVGGSTIVGALLGFLFKSHSHKVSDSILSFAAGVMLAVAVTGLILPSINESEPYSIIITVVGILLGAVVLNFIDKLTPHLHRLMGTDIEPHARNNKIGKVLLFVIAIAIHNLPEGIAAGIASATANTSQAITVAGGIALQNLPEGMVIIAPMLAAGISKKKTFLIAISTGLIEVVGAFIGFFASSISAVILPFALAFAGGTMIYVISDEMIPETHAHGNERLSTFVLIIGFSLMLAFDFFI